MSQYLLLRDNKQSGPYSFEELTAKGLKGYDLIWIEGKSAAWRYPSEIPEFKPFAPVVEEQPYDRFYKRQDYANRKQSETTTAASSASRPASTVNIAQAAGPAKNYASTENIQAQKKSTLPPAANRHVVVILPGGMKTESAADKAVFHETVESKIIESENKINHSKEPATKPAVPVAMDPDNLMVTFTRQPANGRAGSAKNRPNPGARTARMLAGALVVLSIGVAIGWGYSRLTIVEHSAAVSAPSEVVDIPEPQPVYNNEAVQSVSNDITATETEPADEQVIPGIYQDQVDSSFSKVPASHAIQKKPAVKPKKQVTDAVIREPQPVIQQVEHARNENPVTITDSEEVEKKAAKKNINELIKVSKSDFKIGAFGGISNLKVKVTNGSPYALDLVVVEVKYLLANRKEFKSEKIYFKNVAAGETATQEAPKSARGIEVVSRLSLISSKALGMHQASL